MHTRLQEQINTALSEYHISAQYTDIFENILLRRGAGVSFDRMFRNVYSCHYGPAEYPYHTVSDDSYTPSTPSINRSADIKPEDELSYISITGINLQEAKSLLSYFNYFGDMDARYFLNYDNATQNEYIFEVRTMVLIEQVMKDFVFQLQKLNNEFPEVLKVYQLQTRRKEEQERIFRDGSIAISDAKRDAIRKERGDKPTDSVALPSEYVRVIKIRPSYARPAKPGAIVCNKPSLLSKAVGTLFLPAPDYQPFEIQFKEYVKPLRPPGSSLSA